MVGPTGFQVLAWLGPCVLGLTIATPPASAAAATELGLALAEAQQALERRQEDARALGQAEREALQLKIAAFQVRAFVCVDGSRGGVGGWVSSVLPSEAGPL